MKKKSFLTNIRNKRVIRKINLYFFDFTKNGHIFPSKVCHLQYEHGSLFSREMGNHLGSAFPLHFWLNFFIETSKVFYFALCQFSMSSSLRIQSTLKDMLSKTFFNSNSQRRNMYFEGLFIGLYSL